MNLTPRQLRVVRLIRQSRITRGYSPTMQEIAEALGVSKVTAFEHVEALIRKGVLVREPNRARSLSISDEFDFADEGPSSLVFPLLGRIAAGRPIERCAVDDRIDLEALFTRSNAGDGGMFALRVEGESMRDEGILDGDYVLVERRQTARNGERVVALLPDGETTLKTFRRERNGRIRLQPANPDFEPIIVDDCEIQGVVIGVLRRY